MSTILTPSLTTNLDNQFLQPIITINFDNRPWLPTLIPILTPHHKRQIFIKSQKHHSLTLQHGSIPTAGDQAENHELGKGEGGPREGMIAAGLRKGTIAAGPRGKGRSYFVETPFLMMCFWYFLLCVRYFCHHLYEGVAQCGLLVSGRVSDLGMGTVGPFCIQAVASPTPAH